MIPRRVSGRSGLILLLALLAVGGGVTIVHDHGTDEAAVYDEHCPLVTLALGSAGLTLPETPRAPSPLPALEPVTVAGIGDVGPPTVRGRSARAPPSSARPALES